MFIPSNAIKQIDSLIIETIRLLPNKPKFNESNSSKDNITQETYGANIKFIKGFHKLLAGLFNIEPEHFKYFSHFEDRLPQLLKDRSSDSTYRVLLSYWDTKHPNASPITVELPRALGTILRALDHMNQRRELDFQSILPLQFSLFGLVFFREYCRIYLGKNVVQSNSINKEQLAPTVIVSNPTLEVFIDGNMHTYPDRIRLAIVFMLNSHFKHKKYFDRIELLRYIGETDSKKPLRDLFKSHQPLEKLVKRAVNSSGSFMKNKFIFDVDIEKSLVE